MNNCFPARPPIGRFLFGNHYLFAIIAFFCYWSIKLILRARAGCARQEFIIKSVSSIALTPEGAGLPSYFMFGTIFATWKPYYQF